MSNPYDQAYTPEEMAMPEDMREKAAARRMNDDKHPLLDPDTAHAFLEHPAIKGTTEAKLASYLQQENEVLIERVRKLEADADEYVQQLQIALYNCRAIAALEQEKPSGLHLTAFSLIQKYATEALGDEGLE